MGEESNPWGVHQWLHSSGDLKCQVAMDRGSKKLELKWYQWDLVIELSEPAYREILQLIMVQLRCCYILDTKDVTAARSSSPINSSLSCGQAQAIGVGSILKCHIQLAFILSRQNSHSGSETQAVQQLDQFITGIKKGSLMFPYDARVSLPPLSYICSPLHAKGQALRQVLRRQGLDQSLETWKN